MRFGGKVNVYEEIVAETKRLIEVGALREGDKLPSVRQYAVERKVNPNTVAKAYAVLEKEGLIRVQLKKGAYVTRKKEEENEPLNEVARLIEQWRDLGVKKEELIALIVKAYEEEGV